MEEFVLKVVEDNEEIQKLKSQIQQLYVRDQESGNKIREYQEKMKVMEQKVEDMTKWTNGLVHELKIRYSSVLKAMKQSYRITSSKIRLQKGRIFRIQI